MDGTDPAIEKAILAQVDHAPPLTAEDFGQVTYLKIRHARDLTALSRCPALEILVLEGCDPVSITQLTALRRLDSLTIYVSALDDLTGIDQLPPLLVLDVHNNLVKDLSPLLSRPLPSRLDVSGNPLSETSYREVLPELRAHGTLVTASDEREWRLTIRLHAAGLPFTYYRRGNRYHLARPGLARTGRPGANHPVVAPDELEALLDQDPGEVEKLFERKDLMPTNLG